MQIEEFTKRTGFYPDSTLYHVIEREYERQDENGRDVWKDKDEFCKAYLTNKDGVAERCQRLANDELWRKDEQHRKALEASSQQAEKLHAEIELLKKQLDAELEWDPVPNVGTNFDQDKYKDLADAACSEKLSDEHAVLLLSEMFGFVPERIEVIHEVSTYERNRHGRLRVCETFARDPQYSSTDWNYIRFNCAGCQWEMIDSELYKYED